MGADAQGARARQFKIRDNPSSRGTLRSRAPQPPPPSSSSPRPIYHRSSNTSRRRASLTAGDLPSLLIAFSSPSHRHPFSLSLFSPSALQFPEPPPRHHRATAPPSLPSSLSLPSVHGGDTLFLLPYPPHFHFQFSRLPGSCSISAISALISLGAELPPLPDSPASDEQDHQEEDAEAPAQQDAPAATEPAHMEAPPQTQETPPVPQPQTEPEPIVVPPTDPPV
ncbi:proline-rich receptor-like protein kinase PERK9 [Arachis ipaensis]|uniref:proline-rich receptor-like protein kinase PERK9 n=1 Tax=Arachis ipaensis TaxID=130454 RepID=UPI0007AF91C6|nr:proline-rich receptor-like protein kinase PERK9 [Arachis ipaensis]